MKECRLCKTVNEDSVLFCRICGTKFPEINNQGETAPESFNLPNEIKEIKSLLQTIAASQSVKECTILESNPYSSSENEDYIKEINTYLSQGWSVSGFTCDSSMRVLLTR